MSDAAVTIRELREAISAFDDVSADLIELHRLRAEHRELGADVMNPNRLVLIEENGRRFVQLLECVRIVLFEPTVEEHPTKSRGGTT